ncbi:hypothetical protein [Pseudomonas sp. CNPSo 3701]|uniref:hypothetical protein n=1 Tax=Pseudomonas sp. CNPSo 3701 TaxID=3027943 RepID=UPI0023639DFE|nr:hypothetical protein [Pseudomonas sp. CNPSo 3701]MDD1508906.1 hypothetical protein [Pseudomonas sp. CNPSo 3701]
MNFKIAALLTSLLSIVSCGPSIDNSNETVGLHVISGFGEKYSFISNSPNDIDISNTIDNLDWEGGFHQVILVTSPGISIEVGGSLDPSDGLSSVYRDLNKEIYRVTVEPPATVEEIKAILLSFHSGDNKWESMYQYE